MKDTFNGVSVAQFFQWNRNFLTKVRNWLLVLSMFF
jgi:hypothetical protein